VTGAVEGSVGEEAAAPAAAGGTEAAPAPDDPRPQSVSAPPERGSGFALPFPLALALLCGGLVLSIWGAVRTGVPDLALFGAAVVAALAGLYLVSYSHRPMRPVALPPVPEEAFDDPVEEADQMAAKDGATAPAPSAEPSPTASPPSSSKPLPEPEPVEPGPLPEGAVPNAPHEAP
jgi:hypothetical protein